MPKRTSAADVTLNVALVTLDGHLNAAADNAFGTLAKAAPGLHCTMHCAGEWANQPKQLEACIEAVNRADIIIVCMLFMEEHIKPVLPTLIARRDDCDAMICFMSAGEVMKLTRIGGFSMSEEQRGPLSLLRKLRGGRKSSDSSSGARQMAMLRRLPKVLKFIPGTAQDVRAYFLVMQYWLSGSEDNLRSLIALLISRYAAGPREVFRERVTATSPIEYPETGLYHPSLKERVTTDIRALPASDGGTVGLLVMRSYILAGNTAHYDNVIEQLEAKGLTVIPAFASGLDARPAIDQFFMDGDRSRIDALLSLTSFSLVGGPAYNDASAAEDALVKLDVPYVAAHGTEFQSLEAWESSSNGLLPIETTLMVAIPELDGAIGPTLFAGRSEKSAEQRAMQPHEERVSTMTRRIARLVELSRSKRAERKLAIVLFNFPPNGGAVGTAAFLGVFESLLNTLQRLSDEGYTVDVPSDVDELRRELIEGNSEVHGTEANLHARIPVDDHVRREPWLDDIEQVWGPAPGKQLSDGSSLQVLGRQFGNIFVGLQPAFGYEGDPMRLLFETGFAPTHAFSAFYRYINEDFGAKAVLHFGTHGALEFMPGKQSGMSSACWPDRLIGDLPNFYLYAANNPSEGALAKRRSAATLISYLTPPVTRSGLYRELSDLRASIDRWRSLAPTVELERRGLYKLIVEQANEIDFRIDSESKDHDAAVCDLANRLEDVERALIPNGMHVIGRTAETEERRDWLSAFAATHGVETLSGDDISRLESASSSLPQIEGLSDDVVGELVHLDRELRRDSELPALVHALDGGFVRPVQGGDLLQSTDVLPTGRNIHSFDPYRMPSRYAMAAGSQQASELINRYLSDTGQMPESIALVLWGTDNMKTEGGPIAQALHLLGARPRFDSYGKLTGAELVPLTELGRPRVDVIMTLSGIFRDLLPNQTRLLADASWLAASADEPVESNFVRKHALAYANEAGCSLETAALRVFSNANGAYGSNVNSLIDSGNWDGDDALAEQYSRRKCFAYGRDGEPQRQAELLQRSLQDVDLSYQNLESAELGVTTVDHYFDTLGGISRAIERVKGKSVEVYIGDQTGDGNTIRTLADQVALETRSRTLNPKWYEGMLEHGYEGVRQIETQITNTVGWSATTGKVEPWVYQQISNTFVLDETMRKRLASLNPAASAKLANRLLEAHEREYWSPDQETLEALERAGEELEDVLEGISEVAVA